MVGDRRSANRRRVKFGYDNETSLNLGPMMIYRTVAPTILGTLHGTSVPSTLTNNPCFTAPSSAFPHATVKSPNVVNPG